MKNSIMICDFDGTITKVDSINDFLERFADKKWLEVEDDWVNGKVGTCDAMRLQFGMIKNMTEEKFNSFFDSVEIDPYFIDFYDKAKRHNLKVVIVSDGFEYFVRRVLEKYGITDIEIFSNHFEFNDGNFKMEFPNKQKNCKRNSGTCKCKIIQNYKKIYDVLYYIGDGASDFCPANEVDFLFAKKRLSAYCKEKNIPFIGYTDFKEVINDDRFRFND